MALINESYRKAYTTYERLFWVRDPFGVLSIGHLTYKYDPMFNKLLEQKHRELYPKRKKINLKSLPEDVIEPIREQVQLIAGKYMLKKYIQSRKLNAWMSEHAKEVVLQADWQVCYTSDFSRYSSQTDPGGYARGDVKRMAEKLSARNIPFEIRKFGRDAMGNMFFAEDNSKRPIFKLDGDTITVNQEPLQSWRYGNDWHKKEKGYALIAPITDYMLDAIIRLSNESLFDWSLSCWKAGQNPKVLNPFLPDEVYEKSLAIYMSNSHSSGSCSSPINTP